MSRPDARFRINVTIDDVRAFFFFFFWSPLQTVWRKEKKISREREKGDRFFFLFLSVVCGITSVAQRVGFLKKNSAHEIQT